MSQVMFVISISYSYYGHKHSNSCEILSWLFPELVSETVRFHIFLMYVASRGDPPQLKCMGSNPQ